jgi:hypothetical protein
MSNYRAHMSLVEEALRRRAGGMLACRGVVSGKRLREAHYSIAGAKTAQGDD